MKTMRSKVLFGIWLVVAVTIGTFGIIYLPLFSNIGIMDKPNQISVKANDIIVVYSGSDKNYSIIQVNEEGGIHEYEVVGTTEEITYMKNTSDGSLLIFNLRK